MFFNYLKISQYVKEMYERCLMQHPFEVEEEG